MAFAEIPPTDAELAQMRFAKPKNCARLINRSTPYIYKLIKEGRLRAASGLVEIEHLFQQARNGFPKLDDVA